MVSTDADNRRPAIAASDDQLQLLTTRELMGLLRLSRVGIWRIANRPDAGFPRAVVLGHNQKRWRRREVDAWLDARPRSST
jgi:predicted DNA-binding transcriptional regulator AlpA